MRLYHGTPVNINGRILRPSNHSRPRNGRDDFYLFATHRREQAALFSTSWMSKDGFLTTAVDADPESPLIVFITTPLEEYKASINGTVYSFPGNDFERVISQKGFPVREWISTKGIDLHAPTTGIEKVSSMDELMAAGIQFIFTSEELSKKFLDEIVYKAAPYLDIRSVLGKWLHENGSAMSWENGKAGIGVDPVILESSNQVAPRPPAKSNFAL